MPKYLQQGTEKSGLSNSRKSGRIARKCVTFVKKKHFILKKKYIQIINKAQLRASPCFTLRTILEAEILETTFLFPKFWADIAFPIVPNWLFSGRTKNNRDFGYPEMKITDFKLSGTRLGTTLHHCCLILEMEMESGTKSRFHYLCLEVTEP